jgi:membrane-associated phospholipid phosphatase
MLLSIPPIGGHYLVDVLAGGALALGAIAVFSLRLRLIGTGSPREDRRAPQPEQAK